MSFATDSKNEVLKDKIENDCCSIAFLSAIIKCSGELCISDRKVSVEIFTELEGLFAKIKDIIEQYYGKECNISVMEETNISKSSRYKITLPSDITDQLLKDLGIMSLDTEGMLGIDNGIADFIVMDECCKRSYIKGTFVSCATSNIIIKSYDNDKVNSGYHLEFVFNFDKIAEDFVKLLESFGITAKITTRKNTPIVYIKEYQLICDTLALVGANKAVLDLQNEAAIRELRNNVNRQTNCLNANLNKTVNASIKQLNAIKIIQENIGLESLSESLMELALLRLANPESSLEELRMLFSEPLTKSGINHRFAKIIKIAEDINKSKFTINTL